MECKPAAQCSGSQSIWNVSEIPNGKKGLQPPVDSEGFISRGMLS